MSRATIHSDRNRSAVIRFRRPLRELLVCTATVLAACQTVSPAQRAGIAGEFVVNVPGEPGLTIVEAQELSADIPKAIRKPDKTLLFIYNHGTASGQFWQKCNPDWRPGVTTQLITQGQKLVGEEAGSYDYALYYLCSTVTGAEDLIRRRSAEILDAVDLFRAAGVPSKQIFLVGHSSGASSALVAAARAPEKINAVIASAPGYGYAHLGARGDTFLEVKDIKQRWQDDTAENGHLNAMVLAYDGDRFAPPADMAFLNKLDGVELVNVPRAQSHCSGRPPHAFFGSSCMSSYEATIYEYIRQRLQEPASGS